MSSTASSNNTNKRNIFSQQRSASATGSIIASNFLLTSATAAVEEALNSSSLSNKADTETLPVVETTSEKEPTTPDVFSDIHGPGENKKFRDKLEEFKSSNYCSLDEFNIQGLQGENAIEYVELDNEDNPEQLAARAVSPSPPPPPVPPPACEGGKVNKKQPPPVMKKPDRSEEIMRKLGRSGFDTVSSTSSSITTTSSVVQENGKLNSEGNGVGMIRLSSSKATDV